VLTPRPRGAMGGRGASRGRGAIGGRGGTSRGRGRGVSERGGLPPGRGGSSTRGRGGRGRGGRDSDSDSGSCSFDNDAPLSHYDAAVADRPASLASEYDFLDHHERRMLRGVKKRQGESSCLLSCMAELFTHSAFALYLFTLTRQRGTSCAR